MRETAALFLSFAFCLAPLRAQDKTLDIVHRIKTEAFDNSKVMDHLFYLTDVYGPRLTGSPEFHQAADWAMSRLKEYGIANVHAEKWGPFGRSWSLQNYTLEIVTPRYSHLDAAPLAWSSPTDGIQNGGVLFAPMRESKFGDINQNKKDFDEYKTQWRGKLKGKIVLISEAKTPKPSERPLFRRYTDAQLRDIAKAPEPAVHRNIPLDQIKFLPTRRRRPSISKACPTLLSIR
jgi:carboxypeptidase Q